MVWSLPLLLSVSVEADGSMRLMQVTETTELTEVTVVNVVETLCPLPLQLSVSVEQTAAGD